jgi:recombinational DNA repair ATPase RecF
MRITDIYIKNYRAFYGEHHIVLDKDGKNLMVYGENGSGKSSLFTALQSFFKASVSKVDIEENIFIPLSQKNTASIKLRIRENAEATVTQDYEVDIINSEIISGDKTLIINANKIKGFFDYRSLLETHLKHKDSVNIFEILNEKILPHAENRFTTNEIGNDWQAIQYDLGLRKGWRVVERLHSGIETFSKGFKLLLETIEKDTNIYLKYFDKSIAVRLEFDACYYEATDGAVYGQEAFLKITYAGKQIDKHHLFLNEARLSALAISLYLASIKANPLTGALKVLVLDDLLIGLDMSNRLPLLLILKNHFIEINANERFQIIMTTYDKVWFELVNNYFGCEKWKYIEIYSKKLKDEDFEFPIIKEALGYLDKAKYYLIEKDNKASAVYIRTEFERLIKNICAAKGLLVEYKIRQKEFNTNDFWDAIRKQTDIDEKLVEEIETHRSTVMNPFSHYDLEKPEFERELTDTIVAIEKLKAIDQTTLKKTTIDDLYKKIEGLEKGITKKQTIIDRMREVIKKKTASA